MKASAKAISEYVNLHWRFFLLAILAVQICVLVYILALDGAKIELDTPGYVAPALSFMQSGKMLDPFGNPILFRTPGYPLILALIYACTGGSNLAVVIIQMLMVIAITLMIFSAVSHFTNRSVGILASLFYVLDFTIYGLAVAILTDTSYSFFVTLGAYALFLYLKKSKMRYLVLCYASLNFAMLIRPNNMYLNMLLFVGLFLLSLLKKLSWKKSIAFILMFLAVFGGWSARNAIYFGKPVYTSIRDESVFIWYAPFVYAEKENCSNEEAQEIFLDALVNKYPEYDSMDYLTKVAAQKDIGASYLKRNIPGYIKLNLWGLIKELVAPDISGINALPIHDLLKELFKLASGGMLALSYLIYAVGFLANFRKLTWLDWLLLLATLYFMASTAVVGYSRYRIAFYPICLIGTFLSWRSRLKRSDTIFSPAG